MGHLKLVYSLIQLHLANYSRKFLIGGLEHMEVNLDGVKTYVDLKVIYILDEKDLYPVLLGIDWAFQNDAPVSSLFPGTRPYSSRQKGESP